MAEEKFRKGQVVFWQGDPGDCLYYIRWGSVGVFANYGKENEEKLAELRAGDYFGEMGLLDHEARSATVVSLDRDTVLNRITEEKFDEFLRQNPARVVDILTRLCHKLRDATKGYLEICQALDNAVGTRTGEMTDSGTYGLEQNQTLKAIHDDIQSNADARA